MCHHMRVKAERNMVTRKYNHSQLETSLELSFDWKLKNVVLKKVYPESVQ